MTDLPITFKAEMVRALLTDRKTMTRRLLYTKTKNVNSARLMVGHPPPRGHLGKDGLPSDISVDQCWTLSGWQKVKPGDRLWVRETWAHYQTVSGVRRSDGRSFSEVSDGLAGYRADGFDTIAEFKDHIRLMSGCELEAIEINGERWRPSIHMPRWASRLTLIVTGVTIERLQEISEADAIAEGVDRVNYDGDDPQYVGQFGFKDYRDHPHAVIPFRAAVASFETLWTSIHGDGSWAANPHVVAISFKAVRANIDSHEVVKAA